MAKNKKQDFLKDNWKEAASSSVRIVLSLAIGLFHAVVELAWAFAGFFLLAALILYYKVNVDTIRPFFILINYIQNYWGYILTIIWAYRSYIVYEDLKYK
jgi:hypothetical protein